MDIQEIRDRKVWNGFLLDQPAQATAIAGQAGFFLQSFEWGEFQKAVGRRVYRYRGKDGMAQVIELPLPMGKKYWFIPRGAPIEGIEEEAKNHGALFVRFEPFHASCSMLHVPCSTKPVSPPQTLLLDLSKSEEELLMGMHEKTRYNIRLALRKGVEVRQGTFEVFWKMMEETEKRDAFRAHPKEYYEKMMEILANPSPQSSPTRGEEVKRNSPPLVGGARGGGLRGMFVHLHIAYSGTVPLAAAIVGYFGDTATYLHGASSHEQRTYMGPYALQWQIMREAKKAGYRVYDFWGINTGNKKNEHNTWAGITRFKTGFGGNVIDYPGTFDLPLSRLWYTVYRLGRKVL